MLHVSLNGHPFYISDVLLNQLFGLGFFVVLNAAVGWERTGIPLQLPPMRLLAEIGLASYSLYLLYPALLDAFRPHVPTDGFGRVVGMYGMWLLIGGIAYGFYLAVERRFVARSRRAGHAPRHVKRLP